MKNPDLIHNYIENNELDMEKVLKQYTPYVYKIICNKNQFLSIEDIEEIASDVFLAIWKNQQILDLNRSMSAYLSGITKNLYNKKMRNLQNNLHIDDFENSLFSEENLDIVLESSEKENAILMFINNIKQEDKDIFTLYYYNSKSIKEISHILNISQGKVKSRLFRIRNKIKYFLIQRGLH